jgi:hypothetical protein
MQGLRIYRWYLLKRKLSSFYCFHWAMGDFTADRLYSLYSIRPITVSGCQNRMAKSADLQRAKAGQTLGKRKEAKRTIGFRGIPNHTFNFDGGVWQYFANQRNRFYIEWPPVCNFVAIKRPLLKL